MKYSKFVLFLIVCTLTLFVSCDKDNETDVLPSYKAEMFINTWCSFDSFGQSTILTLANTHKVLVEDTSRSDDKTVSINGTGTWMYYPNNSILVVEVSYKTSSGNYSSNRTSYKVKELTRGKMTLINQETGNVETYYKLSESLNVTIGESLENIIPSNANIECSNTDIISVDSNGKPVAKSYGVAFILIETENEYYIVKVTSLHQSQVLTGYLGESIEKILEVYGEPDVMGSIGESLAIVYRNNLSEGLSALQVQYDPLSLEITRILVQYSSQSIWEEDKDFITSWLNQEGEMYFPDHSMLESPFVISVFESQGKYYISYNNQNYWAEHMHYAPPYKIIGNK